MVTESMQADIAAIVELSLAPAFLLVGIGQFLQLAAARLGRVVDRSRVLADLLPSDPGPEHAMQVEELRRIDKRMDVVNASIFFGTAAMVGVCLVVAALFITRFASVDYGIAIAVAFVLVMGLLSIGLILFLYEVRLANRTIHIRTDITGHK